MDTDLYRAAVSDDVETLQKWLRRPGVDILAEVSRARNTVLHIAAFNGSTRFIQKLLTGQNVHGNNLLLTRQNDRGNTALHEAARAGQADVVQILLSHSRELASMVDTAGETALFKAALAGHTDIIEIFENLLGGAPVEMYIRESDGQTALHCAVFSKQMGVVETLLVHKPILLSAVDRFRRTPLHIVALIPPLKELVPPFRPWLHRRHIKENEKIASMLLQKDKSLCDKMDGENQNPLHIAVKEGNEKVMKLILRYGGDCVEQVDNEGRNILHVAVINAELIYERNSEKMITMLESLLTATKSLINDCDNHGKTALDIAIDSMDKDEVLFFGVKKVLEKHGAIRDAKVLEKHGAIRDAKVKKVLEKHGAIRDAKAVKEAQVPQTALSKSKWKNEIISLNAVLIGAVAFQAPFLLLQNSNPLDSEELKHVTRHEYNLYTLLFYVFFLADTVALCTCVASTILLLFALFGEKEDKRMVQTCFMKVMVSLLAILLAYGSAVALVLGPKYLWLTVTVWFILLVTPFAIRVTTFHSKLYIFTETRNFIWFMVEDTIGLIITLISHVFDIFYTLCCKSLNLPRAPFRDKES